MNDDPIIDLHSDDYFMGEALRQAARAYEAGEVPVGAVNRARRPDHRPRRQPGRIAQGRDGPCGDARADAGRGGRGRLAPDGLHVVCDEGAVSDVRRGGGAYAACARGFWRRRSERRCGGRRAEPASVPHLESSMPDHLRRAAGRMPGVAAKFFSRNNGRRQRQRRTGKTSHHELESGGGGGHAATTPSPSGASGDGIFRESERALAPVAPAPTRALACRSATSSTAGPAVSEARAECARFHPRRVETTRASSTKKRGNLRLPR